MDTSAHSLPWLSRIMRADAPQLYRWVLERKARLALTCVILIFLGAGAYGATIGAWRSALQALYTGIKLPLVFLMTSLGNGLLNGMLAPLLGLDISFRQSLLCVLVSFTFAAVILGSLSPVAAFLVWNTPPFSVATALASPEYAPLWLSPALQPTCGCFRSYANGRPVARPLATCCWPGLPEIFFSVARFAGSCGRSSGTRRAPARSSAANTGMAAFTKLCSRRFGAYWFGESRID